MSEYRFTTRRLIASAKPAAAIISSAALLFAAGQAHAQFNINALGDSITVGVNDVAPEIGGYRFYYNDLTSLRNPTFNYNFIGNLTDSAGNYWARGGAQAEDDRNLNPDVPGMLRAVHNITADPTSSLSAFNPANGKVDAMFIHAGTNSLPGPNEVGTNFGDFGLNNALNDITKLLLAGTPGVSANVSGATEFSTINNAVGVHAQLSNASVANSQSHVFVAGIIPLFEDFGIHSGPLSVYNGVGKYNNLVKNLLDTNTTINDINSSITYHYVDMFSITLAELDLDWLAGLFTSGDVSALTALISPDAEIGGTDYVDWGLGFDESGWDEGALGSDETLFTGFNANLLGDGAGGSGIHPTDLGYAIMANVWYNASTSILIPEPSSLAFILASSTLLLTRRRQPAR